MNKDVCLLILKVISGFCVHFLCKTSCRLSFLFKRLSLLCAPRYLFQMWQSSFQYVLYNNNRRKTKQAAAFFRRKKFIPVKFC